MQIEHVLPMDIEKNSFRIIGEELKEQGIELDPVKEPIIKRVIHTTADFEYVNTLTFSEGVVEQAKEALRKGAVIVTDTNMAAAGINKKTLAKFGGEVICYMADEEVARIAKERQVTRATVSMEKACREHAMREQDSGNIDNLKTDSMIKPTRPLIFAIGNAPTALIQLHEMITAGMVSPALIIGVPVGFVNVVASKELIMQTQVPYIVNKGRKGGSNVAAAICNALLYQL